MATPVVETEDNGRGFELEESQAFFEAQVQELLGMSAEEFLTRWNAGEWDEIADEPAHWDKLWLGMLVAGGQ